MQSPVSPPMISGVGLLQIAVTKVTKNISSPAQVTSAQLGKWLFCWN